MENISISKRNIVIQSFSCYQGPRYNSIIFSKIFFSSEFQVFICLMANGFLLNCQKKTLNLFIFLNLLQFQILISGFFSRLKRLSLIEATLDTTFIFFFLLSSRDVFLRFFEIWFKMILYVPNSSYEWFD